MGHVWLAEHTLLGRKVAVKGLHPQFARNAGVRARFKQEAATLSMLHHPNIVALYDYIETETEAYLVLEYVEGTPLDEYIAHKTGPIPTAQLKPLFAQILDGFIYAHSQQVIHRDIKPSNFLVTADGRVKVLDFGIAKILTDANQKLTKTGTNIGTVLYMSPEQVRGQVVDVRSDIYSLGVTLYQMATGRVPYEGITGEFAVYEQIVNHPLPRASEMYPGVTADIEALIGRATAKELAARFQSCGEFREALMREGSKESVSGAAVRQNVPPVVTPPVVQPTVQAPVAQPAAQAPVAPPTVQAPVAQPVLQAPSSAMGSGSGAKRSGGVGIYVGIGVVVLVVVGLWVGGVFGGKGDGDEERWQAVQDSLYQDSVARAKEDTRIADMHRADSIEKAEQRQAEREVMLEERERQAADDPVEVVEAFYGRINDGDWDGAYAMTVNDPFGNRYGLERYFGCSNCCSFIGGSGSVAYKAGNAIVSFHVQLGGCSGYSDPWLKFRLVERSGEWRIQKRL